MDKKELMKSMIVWKIILMGRSANIHLLIALQKRAETSVIDGAIRDNFALGVVWRIYQ